MSDHLAFDPVEVADCAKRERLRAAEVAFWGRFPEWFSQFVSATGPICHPVHEACRRFFEERELCATRLAAEHRRCSDGLLDFNSDMQCTDGDGARNIAKFSSESFRDFIVGSGAGQAGTETS